MQFQQWPIYHLSIHPLAEIFPLKSKMEIEELAADIKSEGIKMSLLVDKNGRVLDERNLLEVYRVSGINDIPVSIIDPALNPFAAILSRNLDLQHMNAGQRAICAANLGIKLPKKQFKTFLFSNRNSIPAPLLEIAQLFQIHFGILMRAYILLESNDYDLINSVSAGYISLTRAIEILAITSVC